MNILLQMAGICVMIVIFIFYFVDRKSAVRSNQLFLYQAIAIFASLVIDIISLVMINKPNIFNKILTKFVCKLYLADVLLVVSLGLVYVLGDIERLNKKLFGRLCMTTFIVLVIGVVLVFSTPISIHHDPDGLNDYTAGIPVIVTYVESFTVMAFTVFIALFFRMHIYKKRVQGVLIFIGLWVLGASIQGIVNYLFKNLGIIVLSVSLAEAMGALVIYIMLENPSLNLDKVTGAMNQRAFVEYVDLSIRKKRKEEFIFISYDTEMAKSIFNYYEFLKVLTNMFTEFGAKKIFRNDNNDFAIIKDPTHNISIEEIVKKFKDKFYARYNIITEIQSRILYVKNLDDFNDPNDFVDVIDYAISKISNGNTEITELTNKLIDEAHDKFNIRKKCDKALALRKIKVFYQPIFDNALNKFTAAEALVRLVDEDGNLIYPQDFVEDMERNGKIIELGKYVFENVCRFLSENNIEALGLHYIEVNLSIVQCIQDNFVDTFLEIKDKYNINPKNINLEITETGASSKSILLNNMNILKEHGFSFSLDDFGTGNANLNYIVEMPVEIVKFDKTMVSSYFNNGTASYVMNSAISMIKGLGYKIVFEGIETEEQIKVTKQIDIEYVQGYYYSKPIPKEEFITFIQDNNR